MLAFFDKLFPENPVAKLAKEFETVTADLRDTISQAENTIIRTVGAPTPKVAMPAPECVNCPVHRKARQEAEHPHNGHAHVNGNGKTS